MAQFRFKTNDEVVVIAGRDKGKRGRVLRVDRDKRRVVVEGVNIVTRHLKRNPRNPQSGGRVERPASIDVSNVMAWCQEDHKPVRIKMEGHGKDKRRVAVGSGHPISSKGRAKEKAERKKGTKSE